MAHYLVGVYKNGVFQYAYGTGHYTTDNMFNVPVASCFASQIHAASVADRHNGSFKGRYSTHKVVEVPGSALIIPVAERPTEKQLDFIAKIEARCGEYFVNGTKRDASEWISRHMEVLR